MNQYIGKKVRLTRMKSDIRYSGKQKATIYALGLRRRHATREMVVTPSIAGMIASVSHMLVVEEVSE